MLNVLFELPICTGEAIVNDLPAYPKVKLLLTVREPAEEPKISPEAFPG
jgi:hypothetical protein